MGLVLSGSEVHSSRRSTHGQGSKDNRAIQSGVCLTEYCASLPLSQGGDG
jgi:hypothetical protein